ncbi:hypothetical protein OG895_43320 [Streptomyces sp. NBC_00201]|nr:MULTISPECIES: hypothetical protein [unclassified Streptomyces]MCX5063727.1 hypothetical protein [Streptomyces sp. NBC_00452]MCX5251882.1 hypothetical protein [Streptomyces sp. NBC_00201]MCX5294215.1 hypothetical protein [Streptomyces sp. NBC_00183]
MNGPIRRMDERGWGWRQWVLQLLIVLTVAAFIVPLVLYGS